MAKEKVDFMTSFFEEVTLGLTNKNLEIDLSKYTEKQLLEIRNWENIVLARAPRESAADFLLNLFHPIKV